MIYTTQSSSDTLTREKLMETIRAFDARMKAMDDFIYPVRRHVIESPHMVERIMFRQPRCKSRRILVKWQKDKRNWKAVPSRKVLMTPTSVIAHPEVARRMRHALEKLNG